MLKIGGWLFHLGSSMSPYYLVWAVRSFEFANMRHGYYVADGAWLSIPLGHLQFKMESLQKANILCEGGTHLMSVVSAVRGLYKDAGLN